MIWLSVLWIGTSAYCGPPAPAPWATQSGCIAWNQQAIANYNSVYSLISHGPPMNGVCIICAPENRQACAREILQQHCANFRKEDDE
jgi:hypothetical protein